MRNGTLGVLGCGDRAAGDTRQARVRDRWRRCRLSSASPPLPAADARSQGARILQRSPGREAGEGRNRGGTARQRRRGALRPGPGSGQPLRPSPPAGEACPGPAALPDLPAAARRPPRRALSPAPEDRYLGAGGPPGAAGRGRSVPPAPAGDVGVSSRREGAEGARRGSGPSCGGCGRNRSPRAQPVRAAAQRSAAPWPAGSARGLGRSASARLTLRTGLAEAPPGGGLTWFGARPGRGVWVARLVFPGVFPRPPSPGASPSLCPPPPRCTPPWPAPRRSSTCPELRRHNDLAHRWQPLASFQIVPGLAGHHGGGGWGRTVAVLALRASACPWRPALGIPSSFIHLASR